MTKPKLAFNSSILARAIITLSVLATLEPSPKEVFPLSPPLVYTLSIFTITIIILKDKTKAKYTLLKHLICSIFVLIIINFFNFFFFSY